MAKKVAQKKTAVAKPRKERQFSNLFEKTPRTFRIGQSVQPKRDLTRMVRWPAYVLLQRKRRILYKRLKVPPQIHQFSNVLPADKAAALAKLLQRYAPETKQEKRQRLVAAAQGGAQTAAGEAKKPKYVKCGLNHVTTLVEQRKARMVVIAADVDPIELVLWLPQLCRAKDVPYCFVKSKARLGQVVHKKTATCLALSDLRKEDQAELDRLVASLRTLYNTNTEHLTRHSEIVLGGKATARNEKARKLKEAETIQK